MRHRKTKKKINNMTEGRRRTVIKSMVRGVFTNKRIVTTKAKAKALQPVVENIVARAKKGKLHDIRMIERILNDQHLVMSIIRDVAPHYADRKSGFTRIIKYKRRVGDNAELCIFELIGDYSLIKKVEEDKSKDKKKKPAKAKKEKAEKKEKKVKKEKKEKKPAKAKTLDKKTVKKDTTRAKKG